MNKLWLVAGLFLAPLAATAGTLYIDVFTDLSVATSDTGQQFLNCPGFPLAYIPPICSLPPALTSTSLTVGDVDVYDPTGTALMAVMQVMTDINGNFVEEYFTPANSFGPPPPQSTILATLDFNSGGLAVFNVDAADEFRLHEQPYNPSLVIPEPRTWLLLTLGMAAIEGLRRL